MKTDDLLSVIENYEEIRIPIYKKIKSNGVEKLESLSLVDINKTIDEAIEKIRCTKEKSSRFVPWSDKTDLEIAKTRIYLLQRQFSFSSKWGGKRFFRT